MSTPATHDPLVVNTKDGAVWMRRAVTRQGHGLYAVADAPKCCPEFVMATLAELAERGIAGSADALPMPVGPGVATESARVDGQRLIRAEQRTAELEAVLGTHRKDDQAEIERLKSALSNAADQVASLESDLGGASARVAELEAKLAEDPIRYALSVPSGTPHKPYDELSPRQRTVVAPGTCEWAALTGRPCPDHPRPQADVTPQVRKLKQLLAGQRAQAGERP
ncbi:hypothetical protein ACWIID_09300 [Streptomyces phaeochromogenes]